MSDLVLNTSYSISVYALLIILGLTLDYLRQIKQRS